MSIYAELAAALGRHAELSEYAEKIEGELETLASRVDALERPAPVAPEVPEVPEVPTFAADDAAATVS